jgi:hypothetical protein
MRRATSWVKDVPKDTYYGVQRARPRLRDFEIGCSLSICHRARHGQRAAARANVAAVQREIARAWAACTEIIGALQND